MHPPTPAVLATLVSTALPIVTLGCATAEAPAAHATTPAAQPPVATAGAAISPVAGTAVGATSEAATTTTKPADPEAKGIVFTGDWGSGDSTQRKVVDGMRAWCQRERCDAGAFLGDNFYPAGVASVDDPKWETHWRTMYGTLGVVFHPSLGNHDYEDRGVRGNPRAQVDYSAKDPYWQMPALTYTWTLGAAEMFVLDTETWDDVQATWLRGALAGSKAAVKIVYGHHPIYSNGPHGNDKDVLALRGRLGPILAEGGATLFMAGHDHHKEILDAGMGVGLVIAGTGGRELYPYVPGGRYQVCAGPTHGWAHVLVGAKEARVRLVSVDGEIECERVYPGKGA
jgi:hypothetical protein